MCVNDALHLAQDKARIYCEESELWRKDHELAMLYFDFQDVIDEGIALFDSINKIDEDWRARVLKHELEYSNDTEQKIIGVFRLTSEAFAKIEQLLTFFEKQFSVVNAAEFRSRWRELGGVLTPDNEFFVDAAFVALRDTAIDENTNGETFDVSGAR
jgi:hypothetical protein